MEIDNKKFVLQEHPSAIASTFGKRMYSQELIVRVFQYFATSRSLYNWLRNDYQLPSIKTRIGITSKVSALNETCFIHSIFNTLKENQKQCVIMQDEIYVKNVVVSWGNFVWTSGWWSSIPCKNCISSYGILHVWWTHIYFENVAHCKSEFIEFLYEQIGLKFDVINQSSSIGKAFICDGNRNYQFRPFVEKHKE